MASQKIKGILNSGWASLIIVYIVWSTTYLAMRLAVAPENGFPPFIMGGTRLFAASLLLLVLARLNNERLLLTRRELFIAAISGILLWTTGNGMLCWGMQHANSGFGALMSASQPIWVAVINAGLLRQLPSKLRIASLISGFGGVAVLMTPAIMAGSRTETVATVVLLISAVCWGLGSVYQARSKVILPVLVLSAYQTLFGALSMLALSFLMQEPLPQPNLSAWLGWGYLIIFGSVIAYTSFIHTLQKLPITIAMTYAYVNPILALLLGWWLLNEEITAFTLGGAALIIAGVAGIFHDNRQISKAAEAAAVVQKASQ